MQLTPAPEAADAAPDELLVDPEELELTHEAWRIGDLSWKLFPYQYTTYETIWALIGKLRGQRRKQGSVPVKPAPGLPPEMYRVGTVVASRKIGKSYMEVLIACEFCQRYPKSVVRITAPTAVEARSIFEPEFDKVLEDCPADIRPKQKGVDRNWIFPNKSMIVLRGADMKPDRLRGPSSDLNFVDEAAYVTRLQYVVNSILYPMTVHTKGPTILCSTLNQNPSGEFNTYFEKCNSLGQASIVPITAAGFTDAELQAEKNAVDPVTWLIEYMCEMGRDANVTIVPEWTPEAAAALIQDAPVYTEHTPELLYWQRLTSIDFGTVDNSVILTGFLAFDTQTLHITNEELLVGASVTGANVATTIKALEAEDAAARPVHPRAPPTARVGDHNIEMLQTIQVDHKLPILMVNKSELENMVNMLRTFVSQGRLRVDPKCVNLAACLKHGAWTTVAGTKTGAPRKRVFARTTIVDTKQRMLGHYDALAAAIYMVIKAHSLRNSNPLPQTFVTAAQVARHGAYHPERYGQAHDRTKPGRGWVPPTARKRR